MIQTEFDEFLTNVRKVPLNYVKYYKIWIEKFKANLQHDITGYNSVKQAELDSYLADLGQTHADWQVRQAKEAVQLYLYFLSNNEVVEPTDDKIDSIDFSKELVRQIRLKHLSYATEKSYVGWVKRFVSYCQKKSILKPQNETIEQFLTSLAVEDKISKATQNLAFNAILFYFRHVLKTQVKLTQKSIIARPSRKLPVVLSRDEIDSIADKLTQTDQLIVQLLYGTGLRISECMELRIKDIDFEMGTITVRAGKGDKDRITLLPTLVKDALRKQIEDARKIFQKDRCDNMPGIALPDKISQSRYGMGMVLGVPCKNVIY